MFDPTQKVDNRLLMIAGKRQFARLMRMQISSLQAYKHYHQIRTILGF